MFRPVEVLILLVALEPALAHLLESPKSRTEGGRRQGREGQQLEREPRGDSSCARFWPSPSLHGPSESGKIVRQG